MHIQFRKALLSTMDYYELIWSEGFDIFIGIETKAHPTQKSVQPRETGGQEP